MTQAEYQRLSRAVYEYNDNPKKFTDTEAKQIARVAQILGLPFQPESKALQKFFFDLADTALFGLLPEDQRPVSRGEEVFGETRSEKVVSTVANLLGFLVPGTAGIKVGQKIAPALLKKADASDVPFLQGFSRIMQGLKKDSRGNFIVDEAAAGRANRLQAAFQGGVQGAAGAGLANILEDPLGTPARAITGAALGGTLGAIAPSLGNPLALPGVRAVDSMSPSMARYGTPARMGADKQIVSSAAQGYTGGTTGGVYQSGTFGTAPQMNVPQLAQVTPSSLAAGRANNFLVRSTSGGQQTVRTIDRANFQNLSNTGRLRGPDSSGVYDFVGAPNPTRQTNLLNLASTYDRI